MNRPIRPAARLAALIVLLPVLALAGCGRKGPLELPPGANVAPPPAESRAVPGPGPYAGAQPGEPAPPVAPQNRFFLDWLLN